MTHKHSQLQRFAVVELQTFIVAGTEHCNDWRIQQYHENVLIVLNLLYELLQLPRLIQFLHIGPATNTLSIDKHSWYLK